VAILIIKILFGIQVIQNFSKAFQIGIWYLFKFIFY